MTGLLGFVAAGAMEGFGNGLVAQAKAEREERMKELDRQHQLKRDEASREHSEKLQSQSFGHSERMAKENREYQSGENAQTRLDRMSERDEDRAEAERVRRETGGEYRTDDKGTVKRIYGDKITTPT